MLPPYLAACMPYMRHPSCLPHQQLENEKQTRAQMPSCIKHARNPACHCRSYRHTSPPYEWQQAREKKKLRLLQPSRSPAQHRLQRQGSPWAVHPPVPSSGASPEGSSAPVLQCSRSPKSSVSSASRPGSAALWVVPSTQDAWGHVMQTSSISSCKVTTLAAVIPA